MTQSADLQAARDTNRRLNRRLGEAEASLHSLVGQAQRDTNEALRRATEAQRTVKEATRNCESFVTGCIVTRFVGGFA